MAHDLRRHRRHQLKSDCEVWREESLVGDRVLDVSPSGLRVRSVGREVELGSEVQVSLRVPGTEAWIDLQGEVVRRVEGRRAGDEGRSFAVRFRRSDPLAQRLLASVACWYPEAAGGRGHARDPKAANRRRA